MNQCVIALTHTVRATFHVWWQSVTSETLVKRFNRYTKLNIAFIHKSTDDDQDDSAFQTFGGDMGSSVRRLPVAW